MAMEVVKKIKARQGVLSGIIFLVFCLVFFLAATVRAQSPDSGIPDGGSYEDSLNELLSPITDVVKESPKASKGFLKRILEIDFTSIWSSVSEGYEVAAAKFQDVTGISLKDALKWLGNFTITVLGLFVKFIKWLLSFVN